jgi:hypothetical protein
MLVLITQNRFNHYIALETVSVEGNNDLMEQVSKPSPIK